MSDDYRRAARKRSLKGPLYSSFSLRIKMSCSLV